MFKSAWAMLSMLLMATLVSELGDVSSARAQATTSIKCGNGTVTVSTGTNTGTCITFPSSVSCSDKGTKVSTGNCGADGKATCGSASGAGTCTITLEGTGNPPKVKVPSGKTEGGAVRN